MTGPKEIIYSSHKSGFYLTPFKLVLSTNKEQVIRYTLDGSNPTNKSSIFESEILITGQESSSSFSQVSPFIFSPSGGEDSFTIDEAQLLKLYKE